MNKRSIVLILGLAGFTVMADNWVVSPLLPAISKTFGVIATSAGILITAYMIPFGIFQLVFGPLADRFGKKQVVTFSMIFFTFGTGLCAIGYSLGNLMLYRVLAGIFAASVMPISLALIGDLVPMVERQGAIGLFMGISFLGQGLSMAIGGAMAYFISWRGAFVLYAILAILSAILLLTAGRRIPSSRNPKSEFFMPYLRLLSNRESLFTYIVVLFEGILIVGSFSFLGAFISSAYHYNFLQIGLVMTAFGIMTVIGGRLTGKIAGKIGQKRILILGLGLAVVADLLLFPAVNVLGMLIPAVALLGLGFIFAHSTLLTIATDFAQKARGIAMSLVAACFMGGGGVGTAIGQRLIKGYGFNQFFLYYGITLAALIIVAAFLVKARDKLPKTDLSKNFVASTAGK